MLTARQVQHTAAITFAPGSILHGPAFSNTYMAIDGYKDLANTAGAFHSPRYETGGGSMYRWAFDPDWTAFYRGLITSRWLPGKLIWAQLVFRTSEGGNTNYESQVDEVFTWLRSVVGSAPIWVSILHDYTTDVWPGDGWPNHVISKEQHQALAQRAIDNYGCLPGPGMKEGTELGPLDVGQVRNDDVHPNSAGEALLGAQLRDFFDPMVVAP